MNAPPTEPRTPTLADLVEDLGPQLLSVAHAAHDLLAPVREVVVHDPVHLTVPHHGDLILAVGVTPGLQLEALTRAAADAEAAGVVVKSNGGLDGSHPVSVLTAPTGVEWGHLHALLRTAIAAAGGPPLHARVGEVDNLFTLANVVEAVCGGAVVLHDPHWRLLAYSGTEEELDDARRETILGRRAPQHWLERFHEDGSVARLLAGDVVHLGDNDPGLAPRSAIAVRAGTELLGSIWLLRPPSADLKHLESSLTQAAQIAAFELIRHRVASSAADRTQGAVLAQLLAGAPFTPVTADRIGIPTSAPVLLAGFRPGMADQVDTVIGLERLVGMVRTFCEAYRLRSRHTVVHDTAWALVQLPDATARPAVLARLREAHDQLSRGASPPFAAVSRSTTPELLLRARADVESLLALNVGRLLDAAEETTALQLAQLRAAVARDPDLVPPRLRALFEQDQATPNGSVETLRAWLDSNGDVQATARRLNLHHNTVRYRLRRIAETHGIDVEVPEQRFLVELHLRLFT